MSPAMALALTLALPAGSLRALPIKEFWRPFQTHALLVGAVDVRDPALRLPPGTSITNPVDCPVGTLQQDDGRVAEKILDIIYGSGRPDALVMHLNLSAFVGRTKPEVLDNLVQAALRVQARYPGQAHFVLVLRSDGEPALEERKRALRASAVALGLDLNATSGAWPEPFRTLDHTLPGDLPAVVVAAVRVGFGQLERKARQALAAAALLEDRFSTERLTLAADLPKDEVIRALDLLEWQRWLVSEPRGYGFAARIVREIIASEMLTPGQRRRILGRLAPESR